MHFQPKNVAVTGSVHRTMMGQIMDNGVSTDPLAGFGGRSRKGKKKEKKGEKKRKKKGGERKRVKQKFRLQP